MLAVHKVKKIKYELLVTHNKKKKEALLKEYYLNV